MNFRIQNKRKLVFAVLILILILGNIYFVVNYFFQFQELENLRREVMIKQTNEKVVIFLSLFIEKVLKSDKEVPFEERLQLENAVRNINDPEVLSAWEKFTSSTTEEQVQQEVKNLLIALVGKISY